VFTLETKVKIQDEDINKLKESNGELSGSNRMMSSRIDTKIQSMDAEVIVKFDKLVSLQMGLNNKNMFEGDLV
jgi:hypothetical protein